MNLKRMELLDQQGRMRVRSEREEESGEYCLAASVVNRTRLLCTCDEVMYAR